MIRKSNCLFLFFNSFALVAGCFAIGTIIYQIYLEGNGVIECQHAVQGSLLMVLGLSLIGISVLGLAGILFRAVLLLWIYSFVAFILFLGFVAFTISVYVVRNPGASHSLSGIGYKKHHLGDYSLWLHNAVENKKKWDGIRTCLIDHRICKNVDARGVQTSQDFYDKKLSSIEFGCCSPPIDCGFEIKNATFWTVPESGASSANTDCSSWSNDQKELCYDCKSCKAGVVEISTRTWRVFAILDGIDIVIIIVILGLSCFIREEILADKKYSRKSGYYNLESDYISQFSN